MSHDRSRSRAHAAGHSHAPADFGRAFAAGVGLNAAYVAAEAGFGLYADSLALLADAGHNLFDVLGLLLAWGGAALAKRPPAGRRTYGWRGATILAALANGLLLLVAVGGIGWEAVRRFADPAARPRVPGLTVVWVAAAGVAVNAATALLFARGRKGDVNVRGAFLHMAADAAVSAGVVLAGLVMRFTGALWVDPAVSLAVAAAIFAGTWGLLREAFALSVQAAPAGLDVGDVRAFLRSRPGVAGVPDLHVWAMSTTETALTAHLLKPPAPGRGAGDGLAESPDELPDDDAFLAALTDELHARFGVDHVTVQLHRRPAPGRPRACAGPAAGSAPPDRRPAGG